MIELYRLEKSESGDEIEEVLKDLVLAHKVITVSSASDTPEAISEDTSLPALKDEGQLISGKAAIKAHLRELEKMTGEWRKFQSDSCYVDEDGSSC